MKIKIKEISYEKFKSIKSYKHVLPKKPSIILNKLVRFVSKSELKSVGFEYKKENMDLINDKEPCLFLMNHSCFLDLKIAFKLIYPHRFNIVMTDDGFVGKENLMRSIGCIPTIKFVKDIVLVKDMLYTINTLHNSILMYPEASYSFDGTSTSLPNYLYKLAKMLKVPVVMIKTEGAFLHDPLYNNLQLRKVNVKATMKCLLTTEDLKTKTNEEIQNIIENEFKFDNFAYQQQNNILINESFRADSLNRVLYKCPSCKTEHKMEGKGKYIKCNECGKTYELQENGLLKAIEGITEYEKISDWYAYQRSDVRQTIIDNKYYEELDVDIYGLKDFKAIYKLGKGKLIHSKDGFKLDGINIDLHYTQNVKQSYSLYSDFYWYEIDDIICIGDYRARYYCIPTNKNDIVAKVRIATEELYKLN